MKRLQRVINGDGTITDRINLKGVWRSVGMGHVETGTEPLEIPTQRERGPMVRALLADGGISRHRRAVRLWQFCRRCPGQHGTRCPQHGKCGDNDCRKLAARSCRGCPIDRWNP